MNTNVANEIFTTDMAENANEEKYPTIHSSYDKSMYETNAGIYANGSNMKLITPVKNTNNIVKGTKGKTSIFTGKDTSETIPEKRTMKGSVKICVARDVEIKEIILCEI